MLQEVLYMREWVAILARAGARREPRKSPLCQLQAATTDRGDTAIADERLRCWAKSSHSRRAAAATAGASAPFQPAAPAVAQTPVPTTYSSS
jgi:hypothetical protein